MWPASASTSRTPETSPGAQHHVAGLPGQQRVPCATLFITTHRLAPENNSFCDSDFRKSSHSLVGADTGFTHQLEKPRYRRCGIEPFVEPVGIDDRRLPVVDVGQRRASSRRDDGEGLQGFSVSAPALPQGGKRQRRTVRERQEEGLLAMPGPLPLEPPVGRHQAPP